VADILIKALGRKKFDYFREKMGMVKNHFSSRNGSDNNKDSEGVAMQMQCWEKGPTATRRQRELLYKCNSGSSRAMGSSTGCISAEDVGQGGLASA